MSTISRATLRGQSGRARLANALRAARTEAGLTGSQAGSAARMGQSKVSKLERAVLLPSVEDVKALATVYQLTRTQRDDLISLVDELRDEQAERLTLSRRVGEMQHRIGRLKKSAKRIRAFQPTVVFGLLQTEAYATCIFGQADSRQLDTDQASTAVVERLAQQSILDDSSKDITLVMSEGAIRWNVGSPSLMAEQVAAIANIITRSPHVRIGIIPWYRPLDVIAQHGFHIYDDDAVVFGTETATAFLSGRSDIATYAELFTTLAETAIYDEVASTHLSSVAEEYRMLSP